MTHASSGPYISTLIVSMPKSFKNRVKGLMGNYNGDVSDDLVPNGGGEPLPLNSSLEEMHWNFGVTCEYYTLSLIWNALVTTGTCCILFLCNVVITHFRGLQAKYNMRPRLSNCILLEAQGSGL